MLHDRLAAAEWAGNRCHAALGDGEERIDDALAGDHRLGRRELLLVRAAAADGPLLKHGHFHLAVFSRDAGNGRYDVRFALKDPRQLAGNAVRHHHAVLNGLGLLHGAEDVAGNELVPHLCHGLERPKALMVERIHHDAAGDAVARLPADDVQRPLNAIVNGFDEARRKLHGKRRAGGFHRLAGADAAGFFINLNGCAVAAQLDHFADELLFRNAHHVVHLHVRHAVCDDQGAGHLNDRTFLCHITPPKIECPRRSPSRHWT